MKINIAVCMKYVPKITNNPITDREQIYSEINPSDMFAIEEAVRLQERYNISKTIGICMGVASAGNKLKQALAMGLDEVYLLSDKRFSGADTLATSYTLAKAINHISDFELIICGKESTDGSTGQVTQEIASRLDYPCLTNVVSINELSNDYIVCTVLSETGYQVIKSSIPVVISVLKGINEPRTPTVNNLLNVQKKSINLLNADNLNIDENLCGSKGSLTKVLKVYKNDSLLRQTKYISCDYLNVVDKLVSESKNEFQSQDLQYTINPALKTKGIPNEIWVVCQVNQREITKHSYQILTKASELLSCGYILCAVVLEEICEDSLEKLSYYGIEKVYYCSDYKSNVIFDENQVEALTNMCEKYCPNSVLFVSTIWGRWIAPAVAAKQGSGLTADCIDLRIDNTSGVLTQVRSVFGGGSFADIISCSVRPQMATIRVNVFNDRARFNKHNYEIIKYRCEESDNPRIKFVKTLYTGFEFPHLIDAEIVICGGRGVGGKDKYKALFDLAELIGGYVGATRYAVDAGWIDYSHQIGQTGVSVRPKLYIGVGVSGASEHLVGIRDSDCIVCINSDANAPIVKCSDYAIIGDCNAVINNLIEHFK